MYHRGPCSYVLSGDGSVIDVELSVATGITVAIKQAAALRQALTGWITTVVV